MNPSAIYSKTGKGVQEASGKTSHLSRGDRAILSAIDGKITLKDLSVKFDRAPDEKFFALIRKMDQDGFIREVSPGTLQRGAANAPRPAASTPQSKPVSKSPDVTGHDLDFTQIFSAPPKLEKPAAPPSRPAAPPSRPAAPPSDPMAAARLEAEARARAAREAKAKAEADAKAQTDATMRERQEAEARAKAERELKMQAAAEGTTTAEIQARARAEADAKARAALEAKQREEAEARERAAAEARARLEEKRRAEEAERSAKERAEREAQEAKERAARELREKAEAAERARFESAERARREAEDLRLKLEAERRAREEAERRAREEAERTRRENEERKRREAEEKKAREEAEALRKKLEEERKAREEAERKAEEERQRRERQRLEELKKIQEEEDKRRAQDEAERKAREVEERREAEEHQRQIRLAREAEDKKRRDADARKRKEEEARRWEAEEARRKSDDAYRQRAEQEDRERAEREAVEAAERAEAAKKAAEAADALSNSLFADLDSFAKREEEERKAKEEQDKRDREERLRQAKEEEERAAREEAERKARKEEEKRRREEEERKQKEEEERLAKELEARRKEEEEARQKKKREEEAKKAAQADIPISRADHGMGDVQEDMRKLTPEARKALRDRQREVARAAKRGDEPTAKAATAYRRKQPVKWGKPVAIALLVLLAAGLGVLNLMPLSTAEYEKLAGDALGQPVKIGSARMWVLAGVQMRFENVTVGEGVKIAQVRAVPELGSLFGEQKVFSRIELEKVVLPQEGLGGALFGVLHGTQFFPRRVVATDVKLDGRVALPSVNADVAIGSDGKLAEAKLSGERLAGLLTPRGDGMMFEVTIGSFTLPFLNKFTLTEFGAKGTADRQGITVSEFDGRVFDGTMAGNARIQWSPAWSVSGDVRGGGMNAGVFAASLVSDGRFEGKGRYVMAGREPERLYESARLDGSFRVGKGTLSSFDLSRALQSTAAQASGRTQFTEMTGNVSLSSGVLALRDLRLTSGLLNASGTMDVEANGSISGRVNAELRNLRGTYFIGGKLTEPQLRR
jgi:hypothetical protein